ncbi:hypothetical protein [Winogradskyella thalassocola]|uniref:Uncharacterized protein n=1 Tax=Winogradskyella thalassocola TaxID=262004 RepID=A0A1G8D4J8_9FLAO|nr:hypothetical protein [Winogradskyella thalassocola]SDH52473.1 hypothetical protein SAMN04489796_103117 [Winogradskyella thalassocola]
MAQQTGIVPLVGTLNGINFYYLNGKPIARKAGGGFTRKAIKRKASMQRVRENANEFGHCSAVNKAFRSALYPFYKGHKFTHFHSRLMGLFTRLKALDTTHKRGERRVADGIGQAHGLQLLEQFSYTPACAVPQVLPFGLEVSSDHLALTITDFDIGQVGFVADATHIALTYGVLDFDFDGLDYALHTAPPLVLDRSYAGSALTLEPDTLPSSLGTVLCVLGVRFYQEIDGALYVINEKDSVGIAVLKCV